jgi:hypothetical protein
MDIYSLSKSFWDFSFENPEKIKPNHIALYFFVIEHSNRLGWKEKFSLPTIMTMEAIGIKNYKTYYSAFTELVEFGFIKLVEKSKNQYSANVIALVNFTEANTKALSKALYKHDTKHIPKQVRSTVDIDILVYLNTYLHNYNYTDKRKETLKEWIEYKIERKEKYTDKGLIKFISQFDKYSDEEFQAMVDQSIANTWKGLFEIKKNNNFTKKPELGPNAQRALIMHNLKTNPDKYFNNDTINQK